jgi:hypothetical protein
VSCDEMQCGTVVVPLVAEVCVDLSDDGLSVAASDGHVSMCVFEYLFATQALLLSSLTLLLFVLDVGLGDGGTSDVLTYSPKFG